MSEQHHIDETFRRHRKDWEGAPSDGHWDKLGGRLDAYEYGQRRQRIAIRYVTAASVAILLAISVFMFRTTWETFGSPAEIVEVNLPEPPAGPELANRGTAPGDSVTETPETSAATAGSRISDVTTVRPEDSPAGGQLAVRSAAREEEDASRPRELASEEETDNVAEPESPTADIERPEPDENPESVAGTIVEQSPSEQREYEESAFIERSGKSALPKAAGSGDKRNRQDDQDAVAAYAKQPETAAEEIQYLSTIVLIPQQDGTCTFTGIEIRGNRAFADPCRSAESPGTEKIELSLEDHPVLRDLSGLDLGFLRKLEAEAADGPCLPTGNNIRIILRTGSEEANYDEVVKLPMREFCLPEASRALIRDLKKLPGAF